MPLEDVHGIVGQVLDGQVRVDAPIGEGGCSVVYRGHHLGLDVPVAIKCLKLQTQLGTAYVEDFQRRFRDESKIQYRLSQGSLHIVRTIAAGTTLVPATGALVPYMVLEWLEGFPLAEQLRARRERGERGRPLTEVMQQLEPVAEAMAFAHSLGVVHRDLNPRNIFIEVRQGGQQRLKVVDFGVAKVVSDHALALGPRAATLGPLRMFTPAYGAPEQFRGLHDQVSPATDVYAMALVLVEALLDRPPIEAENYGDLLARAVDPLVRPSPWTLGAPHVGEHVEALFLRALAVEPSTRPADIGQLWAGLRAAIERDRGSGRREPMLAAGGPSAGGPSAGGPSTGGPSSGGPSTGGAQTAKGTTIMPAKAPPPTFAAATTRGGTAPMPRHPGVPRREAQPPMMAAAETLAYGATLSGPASAPPMMADSPSLVVDSRQGPIDVLAATVEPGEGRRGASPLSMTMPPHDERMRAEVRAQFEAHRRAGFVEQPSMGYAPAPQPGWPHAGHAQPHQAPNPVQHPGAQAHAGGSVAPQGASLASLQPVVSNVTGAPSFAPNTLGPAAPERRIGLWVSLAIVALAALGTGIWAVVRFAL